MGKEVSLADPRKNRILLLFWSPECGYCQEMLPDLKDLETNPPAGAPEILVVPEATEEDNRQMGLLSPVVLVHDYTVWDTFEVEVTPSAVLVDVEGRVASEVAEGGS